MKMRVHTIKIYAHLISLCMLAALQPAFHHPEIVCVALDAVRARDRGHGGGGCRGFAHVGAKNPSPLRNRSARSPPARESAPGTSGMRTRSGRVRAGQ